jgi:hypothetical protein
MAEFINKTAFINACNKNISVQGHVNRIFNTCTNLKAEVITAIIVTSSTSENDDKMCLLKKNDDIYSFVRKEMKATLIQITELKTKIEYIFGTLFDMLQEIGIDVVKHINCGKVILFSKKNEIVVTVFVDLRKLNYHEGAALMKICHEYSMQEAIVKMTYYEKILNRIIEYNCKIEATEVAPTMPVAKTSQKSDTSSHLDESVYIITLLKQIMAALEIKV